MEVYGVFNKLSNDTDIDGKPPISMDRLYPALVQCFGIIILGYVAGRLKIITNVETKGMSTFVGTFALPSLIFLSLMKLNWKTVNWTFLLAILISKAVVFLVVVILSLSVARPINYGRAGLLAIFCTQSNDFAIGYPIVLALYQKVHPDYASYLYLLSSISFAILNPIGYILIEITKQRENNAANAITTSANAPDCPQAAPTHVRTLRRKFLNACKTFNSIFFNPILLMTVLGVIGGFIFRNGLPEIISGVLQVLGNSFAATALFLLGQRIVGKWHQLRGSGLLLPVILTLVKLLVLPLVTRQTVNILHAGYNSTDTTDLSKFGFLYGTFPSALAAFVVAARYNMDVDLVASSIVVCTVISAPLMYISAKMISLTNLNPSEHLHELDQFSFDISAAGVIACVYVISLFIMSKKVLLMPHKITMCLVLSQLLCCIGVIMWTKMEGAPRWATYIQFFLFSVGTASSRLWTAFLAIALLFLQSGSLCFVLKLWPYMNLFAWGLPAIASGVLILKDGHSIPTKNANPILRYGNAQAAIRVFTLVVCFIMTVGCLVLHQRYKKRFEKLTMTRELSSPDTDSSGVMTNSTSTSNSMSNMERSMSTAAIRRRISSHSSNEEEEQTKSVCSMQNGGTCCSYNSQATTVVDIAGKGANAGSNGTQDNMPRRRMCSPSFGCTGSSCENCQSIIQRYEEQARQGLEPLESTDDEEEQQTLKHVVLLILLSCSMFVGLALSIWTLVVEGMSGIYLELSFLDAFLNSGQSLIVLAIFISDTLEFLSPLMKYWRKIWYGANVLTLPDWVDLSPETQHICNQFQNHHLDTCKTELARDKRVQTGPGPPRNPSLGPRNPKSSTE